MNRVTIPNLWRRILNLVPYVSVISPIDLLRVRRSVQNKDFRTVIIGRLIFLLREHEKGSRPRLLPITSNLIAMLNMPAVRNSGTKTFEGSLRHFARTFRRNIAKTAHKLNNPRINQITFHTFRHWKATMEFHRTKNILHVMEILGHRNIQSTLIYTQLVNFENDNFHSAVAANVDEAYKRVDAGFDYVTGDYDDGGKIFRKRK